ncbi:MAG: ribonuclease [Frankiales bacterium]|nr:ribonuclease [Frankiales bacterium]
MPSPRVHLPVAVPGWDALRTELQVPGPFPPEVLAEADAVQPTLPSADRTDVPFLTIDPPGSTDLDQAMALSRTAGGYQVLYAIADVAAFVRPGGAIDVEAHKRGETLYAPDERLPLHPPVLSEDRASLLADQERSALVWDLQLDGDGELVGTSVAKAIVKSRRKLDYPGVQADIDAGTATPDLLLLKEIGIKRLALARARGAVDLPSLEQEVSADGTLSFRAPLPCEQWNAQISLLTGMAAAKLMLDGKVGLLRTLPTPPQDAVDSLRRSAMALGISWKADQSYGQVLSALDPHDGHSAALLNLATRLLRGAGYTAFDGSIPEITTHSAVAAAYAHCTAPLRRLADRYVGEVCVALCAGLPVPVWAREALPTLPEEMAAADHRAHSLDRAAVDLAEAMVLQHRVGETFPAVVVEASHKGGTVQLTDPAVRGKLDAQEPPLGQTVSVRLTEADPQKRSVRFQLA